MHRKKSYELLHERDVDALVERNQSSRVVLGS